ncbi:MAG: mechanosensitive ion channel [Clostridioides sp.]|jgi:small conductance mechanosensitive channel|nr:mechanosensitive ion channel [Clostridioides sp.]
MNESAVENTVEAGSLAKRTITSMFESIVNSGPSIIYGIIIFVIGLFIAKFVKKLIIKLLVKYRLNKGVSNFIAYAVYFLIMTVVSLISLRMFGIETTSFVAVLGAAGFSIGLAFKEILSNLGAGMIILFFKPFNIGDYIQGSGEEGNVIDIQIFSTVLLTSDNKTVIIPNIQLTGNNITNYTNQRMRRVDYSFDLAYDTDISMVKQILADIFTADPRIVQDPKPLIGLNAISNNTIQIVGKPWVKTEDYWSVYYDVMEEIKYKFDENGVKVPYNNIFKID